MRRAYLLPILLIVGGVLWLRGTDWGVGLGGESVLPLETRREISKIEIKSPSETVVLSRRPKNSASSPEGWEIEGISGWPLEEQGITTLLHGLDSLIPLREAPLQGPQSWERYGLASSERSVHISYGNETSVRLLFGGENRYLGARYVSRADNGSPIVLVTEKSVREVFQPRKVLLRQKVIPVSVESIVMGRLTVRDGGVVRLEQREGGWFVDGERGDETFVRASLERVLGLTVDEMVDLSSCEKLPQQLLSLELSVQDERPRGVHPTYTIHIDRETRDARGYCAQVNDFSPLLFLSRGAARSLVPSREALVKVSLPTTPPSEERAQVTVR